MFRQRILCGWVLVSFIAVTVSQPVGAAPVLGLPVPGSMVNLSPAYEPLLIKGLKVHAEDPLNLDFIVDTGNSKLTSRDPQLKIESEKLIKYFFAALTLPEADVWVNLSPYEKNRIIPETTGQTEMGRDMLAQDYMLKQITASLIYPEKGLGKEFWDRIYRESKERFGTAEVPVNTFNKVWIVADKASVYEAKDTVLVVNSHLKVMLEEDYLALSRHAVPGGSHNLGSQIIRVIILPALDKEVNQGKNFANLRQIFHALILAKWYKESLKTALLNQVYSDKNKIVGLRYLSSPNVSVGDPEYIYQQYLKAYKKGVFNYIKEDIDQATKQPLPRKYFSGGVSAAMTITRLSAAEVVEKGLARPTGILYDESVTGNPEKNAAMSTPAMVAGMMHFAKSMTRPEILEREAALRMRASMAGIKFDGLVSDGKLIFRLHRFLRKAIIVSNVTAFTIYRGRLYIAYKDTSKERNPIIYVEANPAASFYNRALNKNFPIERIPYLVQKEFGFFAYSYPNIAGAPANRAMTAEEKNEESLEAQEIILKDLQSPNALIRAYAMREAIRLRFPGMDQNIKNLLDLWNLPSAVIDDKKAAVLTASAVLTQGPYFASHKEHAVRILTGAMQVPELRAIPTLTVFSQRHAIGVFSDGFKSDALKNLGQVRFMANEKMYDELAALIEDDPNIVHSVFSLPPWQDWKAWADGRLKAVMHTVENLWIPISPEEMPLLRGELLRRESLRRAVNSQGKTQFFKLFGKAKPDAGVDFLTEYILIEMRNESSEIRALAAAIRLSQLSASAAMTVEKHLDSGYVLLNNEGPKETLVTSAGGLSLRQIQDKVKFKLNFFSPFDRLQAWIDFIILDTSYWEFYRKMDLNGLDHEIHILFGEYPKKDPRESDLQAFINYIGDHFEGFFKSQFKEPTAVMNWHGPQGVDLRRKMELLREVLIRCGFPEHARRISNIRQIKPGMIVVNYLGLPGDVIDVRQDHDQLLMDVRLWKPSGGLVKDVSAKGSVFLTGWRGGSVWGMRHQLPRGVKADYYKRSDWIRDATLHHGYYVVLDWSETTGFTIGLEDQSSDLLLGWMDLGQDVTKIVRRYNRAVEALSEAIPKLKSKDVIKRRFYETVRQTENAASASAAMTSGQQETAQNRDLIFEMRKNIENRNYLHRSDPPVYFLLSGLHPADSVAWSFVQHLIATSPVALKLDPVSEENQVLTVEPDQKDFYKLAPWLNTQQSDLNERLRTMAVRAFTIDWIMERIRAVGSTTRMVDHQLRHAVVMWPPTGARGMSTPGLVPEDFKEDELLDAAKALGEVVEKKSAEMGFPVKQHTENAEYILYAVQDDPEIADKIAGFLMFNRDDFIDQIGNFKPNQAMTARADMMHFAKPMSRPEILEREAALRMRASMAGIKFDGLVSDGKLIFKLHRFLRKAIIVSNVTAFTVYKGKLYIAYKDASKERNPIVYVEANPAASFYNRALNKNLPKTRIPYPVQKEFGFFAYSFPNITAGNAAMSVKSASKAPGGIDFNASRLSLRKSGAGVGIKFNQAMIARFRQGDFAGIVPVITAIREIPSMMPAAEPVPPESFDKA